MARPATGTIIEPNGDRQPSFALASTPTASAAS